MVIGVRPSGALFNVVICINVLINNKQNQKNMMIREEVLI